MKSVSQPAPTPHPTVGQTVAALHVWPLVQQSIPLGTRCIEPVAARRLGGSWRQHPGTQHAQHEVGRLGEPIGMMPAAQLDMATRVFFAVSLTVSNFGMEAQAS